MDSTVLKELPSSKETDNSQQFIDCLQIEDKQENETQQDYNKSLRELNIENMKLTEELIQQNLDQTSNIEKISNEKSKLLLLLNQQKIQNKKLADENQLLAAQLSQLFEVKNNLVNENLQKRSISNFSILKTPVQGLNQTPSPEYNEFEPGKSSLVSNVVSPMSNRYNICASNQMDSKPIFSTPTYGPNLGYFDNKVNIPSATYTINDIILLQNHIGLLERENSLLRRELTLAKQQEPYWSLKIKELELENRSLTEAKAKAFEEIQDLKEMLKARTEEANEKILQLAQINQDLNVKLRNYQKVIEKLANELYTLNANQKPPSAPKTEQKLASSKSAGNLLADSAPNSQTDRNNRTTSYCESDDIIQLRQENFKLKADLKAMNDRSELLLKENIQIKEQLTNQTRYLSGNSNENNDPKMIENQNDKKLSFSIPYLEELFSKNKDDSTVSPTEFRKAPNSNKNSSKQSFEKFLMPQKSSSNERSRSRPLNERKSIQNFKK